MLAECEAELRCEYVKKVQLLNVAAEADGMEYKLIELTDNGPLKVQILKDGVLQRLLGLKSIDRKVNALSQRTKMAPDQTPVCQTEQQLNAHLFETIQLIEKLRTQFNLLK
jgi:hypothetical protein